MKIFSSVQIKSWDAYSIQEQHISSDTLMERVAVTCCQWLISNQYTDRPVHIFCGKGNNGGDGLAIARILVQSNVVVNVFILEPGKTGSADFQINLQRLHQATGNIHFIQSENFFPAIEKNELVIDALFGTGLNKPLDGMAELLVRHLNDSHAPIISIDIPSGMFCDRSTRGFTAVQATHTLSFQCVKLAFLMPENDGFTGEFHILDIGLSSQYENDVPAVHEIMDEGIIKAIARRPGKFFHKGNFGHAAIIAGSYGMMGAAVLAARGCLSTGAGKLTCYVPSCGYDIMQSSVPEAMCRVSGEKTLSGTGDLSAYDAVGIGPGIGLQNEGNKILREAFTATSKRFVLDADALNSIAADKELLTAIPKTTVITPHIREFERMFGAVANDFERIELAMSKASQLNIYIVLKGHYTAVITPLGKVYFNNTGNVGMAKAGMGDVLTGMITGLMAQQYPLPEAAILGVYLHGLAGDIALAKYSQQSMLASDLLDCTGEAWKIITQ